MGRIIDKDFKNKQELLDATLDEFCKNSYENASLNVILKTAKLSKGTFYYHFKNKEDLYLFLLKTAFNKKWSFINEHTKNDSIDFNKIDIFDKFLFQAKMGLLFAETHPRYHQLSKMFSKEKNNEIYRIALETLNNDSTNILEKMIEQSFIKNELDSNYNKAFTTKLLTHLFSTFDEIFNPEEGSDIMIKNLEEYIRFMKYGLKSDKIT